MVLGDAALKLEELVWILDHISRSVHPKSVKRGQMTTLNVVFHVVVSVFENYKLVKI